MKHGKIIGFAVAAAAALMAFVGTSTASATVLCETIPTGSPTGTTCPENWALFGGSQIHAVNVGKVKWTSNESFKPDIECEEWTFQAEVTVEGEAAATGKANIVSWFIGKCGESEVKVLNKGSLEVHWISGTHNGTVTGTGQEITVTTPSIFGNIHCIYKSNATDLGVITGSKKAGETAIWHAEKQPFPFIETSGLCPAKPSLDATWSITTPDTLSVASHT